MLQEPMSGSAKVKRKQWVRKKVYGAELHTSIKMQKHQFQRNLRNGKEVELPMKGNFYRKVPHRNAKWHYVS